MDRRGKESVRGETGVLNEADSRTLLRMGTGPGFRTAVKPVVTLDEIKDSTVRGMIRDGISEEHTRPSDVGQ